MNKAMGSFLYDRAGEIVTPAPYVRLLKNRGDFSGFLSDGSLFFDGRFAFYPEYERGNFFERQELVALILRGEHELLSLEDGGEHWELSLKHTDGDKHTLYFVPVPKDERKIGAIIKE